MLRVLMIAYTRYAFDSRVKRHARALAARGDQVDVICLENIEQGYHNRVNVIGLPQQRYRGPSRAKYISSYIRFFLRATATALHRGFVRRYDVVIVCSIPDLAVLCAIPCKLLGSKVVLDIHDTMPELYRDKFEGKWGTFGARALELEERASSWFANSVLAVHEPHKLRLQRSGIPAHKIRVVSNVPDPEVFNGCRSHLAAPGDFTVVCHGTVTKRLGLEVLVDAINRLDRRIPGLNVKVIGTGDHLAAVRVLVQRLGLDDCVKFLAPVPVESLPELISDASLGVVPNVASFATHLMLPVKLLEFAALGVPIVASRLRTIEYYFDNSSAAFFRCGDGGDLAQVIDELYRNPQRRFEIARNANRVVKRMNFERQRETFYDVVDTLAAPTPGENEQGRNFGQGRSSA